MGILQGDSPTPGPAMYWQPYHTDESALRARPSGPDDLANNNNNDHDSKMIQQQQHMSMFDPSLTFHHHIKHEREDALAAEDSRNSAVTQDDSIGAPIKAEEPNEASQSGSTPASVMCAGCGYKIADRFYLVAVDKAWHSECLRCDECRRPLDSALSCFARQSRIYCREDYYRLFGGRKQCAKCNETLQPDELVMRGREHLFHTRCFSCHVCQTHLEKGSTFGMIGALIFCQQHYQPNQPIQQQYNPYQEQPYQQEYDPHGMHYGHPQQLAEPMDAKVYGSSSQGSPAASLKGQRVRTKRRPSTKSSDMISIMNEDDSYMSVDGMLDTSGSPSMLNGCMQQPQGHQQQPVGGGQQKTKRLRTSFKHHQLRMLKSYFATNHNPDAKDLKQLSQKTTLSKRVLQVWFQNARAKWRRLVQKSEGGAASGSGNSGSGPAQHNMSSSSSNCSGSGNENGSPVPSSLASPHHLHPSMMMGSFIDHSQQHMMTSSRSRMSLYDDLSMSGSSVASVGFPSPL